MPVEAQGKTDSMETMDSVEVSLLTCSPHEEIYSLYGHTAIRYHDMRTGEDWAFNYGVFNFNKPFFVLRFALGITDYELGVIPFDIFKQEYIKFGSQVTEQVINMNAKEKHKIYDALKENYLPQNKIYRYNYYYDNCTTRARDMIERCLDGKVEYTARKNYTPSYREMIHEHTKGHPWAEFSNDLCLGFKSDIKTNLHQQQFLPENLMHDFDHAKIYSNGVFRPLVKEKRVVVEPGLQIIAEGFPLTPMQCACILLCVSLLIIGFEYKKKKTCKVWDVFLMTINGLAGIIILALFFSEHPTTSTNLQILLISPLPLFFLPSVIRGRKTIYWKLSGCLIILFFIGALLQDYAEGMEIVALSLLTRCWIHLKYPYQTSNK